VNHHQTLTIGMILEIKYQIDTRIDRMTEG
jgi:hypothetical protein